MKTNMFQQGDVLIKKVDCVPNGRILPRKNGRIILAEGEATGHCHSINVEDADLIQEGEKILLRLGQKAALTHEEHKLITLEPGIYEIGRVVEKDWLSGMTRQVKD